MSPDVRVGRVFFAARSFVVDRVETLLVVVSFGRFFGAKLSAKNVGAVNDFLDRANSVV